MGQRGIEGGDDDPGHHIKKNFGRPYKESKESRAPYKFVTTQFEYGLLFRRNQKNQGHHIKKNFGRQGPPEIQEVL